MIRLYVLELPEMSNRLALIYALRFVLSVLVSVKLVCHQDPCSMNDTVHLMNANQVADSVMLL